MNRKKLKKLISRVKEAARLLPYLLPAIILSLSLASSLLVAGGTEATMKGGIRFMDTDVPTPSPTVSPTASPTPTPTPTPPPSATRLLGRINNPAQGSSVRSTSSGEPETLRDVLFTPPFLVLTSPFLPTLPFTIDLVPPDAPFTFTLPVDDLEGGPNVVVASAASPFGTKGGTVVVVPGVLPNTWDVTFDPVDGISGDEMILIHLVNPAENLPSDWEITMRVQ